MRKSISKLGLLALLMGCAALADTPPPGAVNIKGASDGTKIGNVSDSLKVNVTNSLPVTIPTPVPVTQSGSWTTGRTWTLLNSTDSVNVGNFPSTFGVTQGTSPWVVSGNVGRTWNLSFADDMVDATGSVISVSNFPSGFSVTQGTSPWVVSGTVTANAGTGTFLVDGSAHTQPVSGTVTANAGTGNFTVVQPTGSNLHVAVDSIPTTTVTGTITANQGTSPWVSNISQFGGSNVVTGTGASGSGIPRVTVSNDSNVLATQSGTWNINNISGSVSLPTGAATESSLAKLTQTQGSTTSGQSGPLIQGAATTDQPSYTTAQTSPLSLTLRGALRSKSVGLDSAGLIRNDYSSVNVTTSAYTQLLASTSSAVNFIYVFDSSGQTLVLAFGAAASEVDQLYIVPGGDDLIPLYIPAGTRLSIKAISANATSGELDINLLK